MTFQAISFFQVSLPKHSMHLSFASCVPDSPYPWSDYPNNNLWRLQITKLSLFIPRQHFESSPFLPSIIILLSSVFSNTVSLCHSLNVRDQFSHPYRHRGKITAFHLIFMLSGSKW